MLTIKKGKKIKHSVFIFLAQLFLKLIPLLNKCGFIEELDFLLGIWDGEWERSDCAWAVPRCRLCCDWAELLYTCTVFSFYVMILLSQEPNVGPHGQTPWPDLRVRPGLSVSDR